MSRLRKNCNVCHNPWLSFILMKFMIFWVSQSATNCPKVATESLNIWFLSHNYLLSIVPPDGEKIALKAKRVRNGKPSSFWQIGPFWAHLLGPFGPLWNVDKPFLFVLLVRIFGTPCIYLKRYQFCWFRCHCHCQYDYMLCRASKLICRVKVDLDMK